MSIYMYIYKWSPAHTPSIEGGIQVHEYIKAALRSHNKERKNLSTKFWCGFVDQYDFGSSIIDDLELPADSLVVNEDLVNKISMCHDANPATRSTEQLERYLEFSTLNRREIYGIIGASEEGPSVSRAFSVTMKVAVLKYFARTAPK